jgi:hypothetical protein
VQFPGLIVTHQHVSSKQAILQEDVASRTVSTLRNNAIEQSFGIVFGEAVKPVLERFEIQLPFCFAVNAVSIVIFTRDEQSPARV